MKHAALAPVPRWTVLVWVGAGLVYLVTLALPIAWLPSDDLGIRRFISPEIAPGMTVSQTFEMTGNGLHAVRLSPAVVGQVSGDVRLELHDLTGHGDAVIRSAVVPAASFVGAPTYVFAFAPVGDSKERPYRLDIVSPDASPARGVALRATKGARYRGGAMVINDIGRWADLAFETKAPVQSRWGTLVAPEGGSSPWRTRVILLLLVAIWVGVGLMIRALCGVTQEPPALHEPPEAAA